MKHRWQLSTQYELGSAGMARGRKCQNCGKIQLYEVLGYDRIDGSTYGWRPLIGRCIAPAVAGLAATWTRDVRGSAGSVIMDCPKCERVHYRLDPRDQYCVYCGTVLLIPRKRPSEKLSDCP